MKSHLPVPWTDEDALAVRALLRDETHRKAMDWIIHRACGLYDASFRDDGDGGQRATDHHEGRRFVGNSIVKMGTDEVGTAIAQRVKKAEAKK